MTAQGIPNMETGVLMSENSKSRGNKNSRLHIRHRRILVGVIIRDMMKSGEVPINKEVVLQRLESFGYGTSKRNLERDIASIFTSNISAVLPNRKYKINPGTRYMKILEDEHRDEFYSAFFRRDISRQVARKKRRQIIESMLARLGLPSHYMPESLK